MAKQLLCIIALFSTSLLVALGASASSHAGGSISSSNSGTATIQCYVAGPDPSSPNVYSVRFPATQNGAPAVCARYQFSCTAGDSSCTPEEAAVSSKKWAYTWTTAGTCSDMQSSPEVYLNTLCCSEDLCNSPDMQPPANQEINTDMRVTMGAPSGDASSLSTTTTIPAEKEKAPTTVSDPVAETMVVTTNEDLQKPSMPELPGSSTSIHPTILPKTVPGAKTNRSSSGSTASPNTMLDTSNFNAAPFSSQVAGATQLSHKRDTSGAHNSLVARLSGLPACAFVLVACMLL